MIDRVLLKSHMYCSNCSQRYTYSLIQRTCFNDSLIFIVCDFDLGDDFVGRFTAIC